MFAYRLLAPMSASDSRIDKQLIVMRMGVYCMCVGLETKAKPGADCRLAQHMALGSVRNALRE